MPHKTHAAKVPSSAQTIVRSVASAGTIYTVPAGKTLVILSCWSTAAGSITITSEDSGTGSGTVTLIAGALAMSCEVRCAAGTTVTGVGAVATGFSGYLESA